MRSAKRPITVLRTHWHAPHLAPSARPFAFGGCRRQHRPLRALLVAAVTTCPFDYKRSTRGHPDTCGYDFDNKFCSTDAKPYCSVGRCVATMPAAPESHSLQKGWVCDRLYDQQLDELRFKANSLAGPTGPITQANSASRSAAIGTVAWLTMAAAVAHVMR